MKKICYILLLSQSIFAQNMGKVADNVFKLQQKKTNFIAYNIFSIISNFENETYKKATDSATIVKLNISKINEIVAKKSNYLELVIPYQNKRKTIILYKIETQTAEFKIITDKNNVFQKIETGVHYRGIVKGNKNSLVSMNFFNNQMNGIISDSKDSNIVIGKLEIENNVDNYIIYSDNNLKSLKGFSCETKEGIYDDKNLNRSQSPQSERCVTLYFEIGYSIFVANGSSVSQTTNWINSVFNNVQTIFANDGITTALKSIFIWTNPDPYNGSSSLPNLLDFKQTRPYFDADIAQLLIINGGQGGLAETINGLCSEEKYSFSDVNVQYNTVPTYSWTVNVIAHEFGHLFGSQHTHSCAWNGNGTAIDGCGQQSYPEGTCPIVPIPDTVTKGTIMSYCHLIQGVGVNFANGFGPQPASRMLSRINAAKCLSTDCINTCITSIINLKAENITSSTAKLSFVDMATVNSATQWEVATTPFPFSNPTWTTVATSTNVVTNLLPNTYYEYLVRPKCNVDLVPANKRNVFATSDDFCGNSIFTDSGGSSNNHTDLESWVRVIIPNLAAKKMKVVFSSFDLEQDYDFLYIHDGSSTSAPLLTPAGLTGNVTPPNFESTASDGALTFRFKSDDYVNAAGWIANFSCLTLGSTLNNFVDFQYNVNKFTKVLTISSANEVQKCNVYAIDGKLLFENKVEQLNPTIDLSSYAQGTYIVQISILDKLATFKIIR